MMFRSQSAEESLRRVFAEGFSIRDIAEPLASFDAEASIAEAQRTMNDRAHEVVGIRHRGLITGFVRREAINKSTDEDGRCQGFFEPFGPADVVPDASPLADAVAGLNRTPRLFVSILGSVGGIVTRSDLQKPPVRMWLFGMVTLIEMRCSRMIAQCHGEEDWKQFLSEGRLAKAGALLEERRRRNQNLDLLGCLQLSDKGQIIARSETARNMTRYTSRRKLERAIKGLEALRNNLAHSQDIIANDWETIVDLSENLENIIQGPPGLNKPSPISPPDDGSL